MMMDDTTKRMEKRLEIIWALVKGDPERNMRGVITDLDEFKKQIRAEVTAFEEEFEEHKAVWDARANMFRGILLALGGNGILGVLALIMQIFGIGG